MGRSTELEVYHLRRPRMRGRCRTGSGSSIDLVDGLEKRREVSWAVLELPVIGNKKGT